MEKRHVTEAARRIEGLITTTPVLRCAALDQIAGAQLYFKAENLQRIGAFKARGAMHAVGRLSQAERERGIITYSSGNHAQAVALAAKQFGIVAEIAMPIDAPKVKVDVVRKLGARITFAGRTSEDRHQVALKIQARTNGVMIEPFDHADTIAGQGTATLEMLDQLRAMNVTIDALVVPVGGGGLLAGACLATEDTDVDVYGVEPVGCDSLGQSLAAGKVVGAGPGPTIADGLKPTRIGELNFAVVRDRIAGSFSVDDQQIGLAMTQLLMHGKVLVEPSGAAALAVCLHRMLPRARRIGVLLSGGNVAPSLVAKLIAEHAD